MRKPISVILIIGALFSYGMTVFAGDIPYSLLYNDNAKLYIGEIVEYDSNAKTAVIKPIMKIKGDVDLEVSKTVNIWEENVIKGGENAETPIFWVVGDKPFKENEQCLVIDFDNNYDNYIFHISGNNPRILKIENNPTNMWGEVQTLLNEGKYEQAEIERLAKLNTPTPAPTSTPTPQNEANNGIYYLYYWIAGAFVLIVICGFIIKNKIKNKVVR